MTGPTFFERLEAIAKIEPNRPFLDAAAEVIEEMDKEDDPDAP